MFRLPSPVRCVALFLAQQTFIAVFGVLQAMAQLGEAPSAKPAAIFIVCRAFQRRASLEKVFCFRTNPPVRIFRRGSRSGISAY